MKKSPIMNSYYSMMDRCNNKNSRGYPYYGGRGIAVCSRWRGNPKVFVKDMGSRPSAKHTLDRLDNNKGYSPQNCRWATRTQQQINRRTFKNNKYGYKGVYLYLGKWRVSITLNKKVRHLGSYEEIDDALRARKAAEKKYFYPVMNKK